VADLKVDYDLLGGIHTTTAGVISEVQGMSTNVDQYTGAYGSGDIAGAMGGFANNWSKHKSTMVNNLTNLHSMVGQTITAFQQTDDQLKSKLTQPSTKAS
jgi:uncharacterized protein YukE